MSPINKLNDEETTNFSFRPPPAPAFLPCTETVASSNPQEAAAVKEVASNIKDDICRKSRILMLGCKQERSKTTQEQPVNTRCRPYDSPRFCSLLLVPADQSRLLSLWIRYKTLSSNHSISCGRRVSRLEMSQRTSEGYYRPKTLECCRIWLALAKIRPKYALFASTTTKSPPHSFHIDRDPLCKS